MRLQFIDMPRGKRPAYLRFAEGVRNTIQNGIIKPGERLPSCIEFSKMVKMHKNTILSGLEEFIAEGWNFTRKKRLLGL